MGIISRRHNLDLPTNGEVKSVEFVDDGRELGLKIKHLKDGKGLEEHELSSIEYHRNRLDRVLEDKYMDGHGRFFNNKQ